jgi:hypothetical protein
MAVARMKKIMVTVPNNWWVNKYVVMRLLEIQADKRYFKAIAMPNLDPPLENFQHNAIVTMLEGDFDYWLSIDDDNPPIRNPLDLIELDKDVICLPTPVWVSCSKKGNNPISYTGYDYLPDKDTYTEHFPQEGLQKVDAIGGGCFIAARRVFEHPEMQKGCFARKLHPDGVNRRSNDISFSERARENGFQLWAHYDYPCMHFKECELSTVRQEYGKFYEREQSPVPA